jgi:hypothetical protein
MLTSLKLLGAVSGSNQRSPEFPELLPDHAARPGTALYNEQLGRQQQREREQRARTDAARKREYENGPQMRECRERREEMREVVHEEVDLDRITVLEAKVRRLEGIAELEGDATHVAA